jgi:hypothetical protein
MSTPNDRRVIYSTYIVPTKTLEMDETYVTQEVFMGSPGKTLGGRGKMTIGTQWGDGFTSMTTTWEDAEANWNVQGMTTNGTLTVSGATDLNDEDSQLDFLYIKNTGLTNEVMVSLAGNVTEKYLIEVPPEGSVYLRGAHADLDCNDVFVKCNGSESTTIEYIVAK